MAQLVQQARGHALENEYNKVTTRAGRRPRARSLGASAARRRLRHRHLPGITNNGLADQLKMVARLIARARSTLGAKRQVFFVSMGGFDLHDNLIANQAGLMQRLRDAHGRLPRQMVERASPTR